MKRFQIGGGNFSNGFFRAEQIESVAGFAEQSAAHGDARALEQIVFARENAGDLHFAFAFEWRGGKNRVQQNVGEQIEAGRKITAQDFRVDAETIIAAVAVNVSADGFDFRRDAFGGAFLRSLQQHFAEHQSDSVVRRSFGENAAFERGAKFHERQAMIFLHEQTQAIGQCK